MRPVCCTDRQCRDVRQFMYSVGMQVSDRNPSAIWDGSQIAGCRDILFFLIVGHPDQPPQGLIEQLRAQGVEMVYIDDTWMRNRYNYERDDRELKRQQIYLTIDPNAQKLASYSAELHELVESELMRGASKKAKLKKPKPVEAAPPKRRVPEGTRDLDLEDV